MSELRHVGVTTCRNTSGRESPTLSSSSSSGTTLVTCSLPSGCRILGHVSLTTLPLCTGESTLRFLSGMFYMLSSENIYFGASNILEYYSNISFQINPMTCRINHVNLWHSQQYLKQETRCFAITFNIAFETRFNEMH